MDTSEKSINKPKKYYNTKRRRINVCKHEEITKISFECDNEIKDDNDNIEEMELIDFIIKYYPNMSFLIEKK